MRRFNAPMSGYRVSNGLRSQPRWGLDVVSRRDTRMSPGYRLRYGVRLICPAAVATAAKLSPVTIRAYRSSEIAFSFISLL